MAVSDLSCRMVWFICVALASLLIVALSVSGYGVNYAIGANNLKFSISSRRNSKETCSRSFRKMLEASLVDMMSAAKAVAPADK